MRAASDNPIGRGKDRRVSGGPLWYAGSRPALGEGAVPCGWVPRKPPRGAPRGPACPAGVPISPGRITIGSATAEEKGPQEGKAIW